MSNTYITALTESLEKKVEVLTQIKRKNEEQSKIIEEPNFSFEKFDINTEEKGVLIYIVPINIYTHVRAFCGVFHLRHLKYSHRDQTDRFLFFKVCEGVKNSKKQGAKLPAGRG